MEAEETRLPLGLPDSSISHQRENILVCSGVVPSGTDMSGCTVWADEALSGCDSDMSLGMACGDERAPLPWDWGEDPQH